MHNKYKYPNTPSSPYQAKYNTVSTNPEEDWIRSQSLFSGGKQTNKNESMVNSKLRNGVKVGEKTAEQLMQDMLKGLNHQVNSPYYSENSQQKLSGILTNQYKRNTYINSLQQDIPKLAPSTAKNYQLLVLLLSQVSKNEVQVKNSGGELQIGFNQKVLDNQEMILERFRKEKQVREEENNRIVKQYQEIIADLQKITEQLVGPPQQSTKP